MQLKAESGLNKQLLRNIQAENSFERKQLNAEVKNGVAYEQKGVLRENLIWHLFPYSKCSVVRQHLITPILKKFLHAILKFKYRTNINKSQFASPNIFGSSIQIMDFRVLQKS